MTLQELFKKTCSQLFSVTQELATMETEIILESVLNCSRQKLYLSFSDTINELVVSTVNSIVTRRCANEPLAYILGKAYFYDREFLITPDVLIPRPDTEVLIEQVFRITKSIKTPLYFADICTGSGIIATILSEHNPHWSGVAIDISAKALEVAKKNLPSRIPALCSDMLAGLKQSTKFNLIVSNPPYISVDEFNTLDSSVKDHEPSIALAGGIDGADFYRYLAINAPSYLVNGGFIVCEIGYNQEQLIKTIFNLHEHWANIAITKDLAGRPRVFEACYLQ